MFCLFVAQPLIYFYCFCKSSKFSYIFCMCMWCINILGKLILFMHEKKKKNKAEKCYTQNMAAAESNRLCSKIGDTRMSECVFTCKSACGPCTHTHAYAWTSTLYRSHKLCVCSFFFSIRSTLCCLKKTKTHVAIEHTTMWMSAYGIFRLLHAFLLVYQL